MPQFSIVVPTRNRADGRLQRCLASVAAQTHRDFECVVVGDGSGEDEAKYLKYLDQAAVAFDTEFRHVPVEHGGRVLARNAGMEAATGNWICHLDSDDAYDPMYLATLAYNIEQEPDARLWVCGVVVHAMIKGESDVVKPDMGCHICPKWTQIRKAWVPESIGTLFNSGDVGTGMFTFRRDCLDVTGLLPEWRTPYDIADGIDEWLGVEPGSTGYGSGAEGHPQRQLVGNPWGEDHALFQKLCLHWEAYLIQAALYVQYRR